MKPFTNGLCSCQHLLQSCVYLTFGRWHTVIVLNWQSWTMLTLSGGEQNLALFLHLEGTPYLWELGEDTSVQKKNRADVAGASFYLQTTLLPSFLYKIPQYLAIPLTTSPCSWLLQTPRSLSIIPGDVRFWIICHFLWYNYHNSWWL